MPEHTVTTAHAPQQAVQGDWQHYVQHAMACRTEYGNQDQVVIADCCRRLALAHLGNHARLGGRVGQAREPAILTAGWLLQLTQRNQLRRDTLYPWLAAALQELEHAAHRPDASRIAALQKLAALNMESRAQRPLVQQRTPPRLPRIAEIDLGVLPAP